MKHPRIPRRALLVAAALAGVTPAWSQAPAKETAGTEGRPLRIVVGYPAGQTIDIIARQFAAVLQKDLGRAVYVDNKAGANGIVGTQDAKAAAGDGNTLLMASSGQLAINPSLYKKLPYDTLKDFKAVSLVGIGPLYIVANPSFPPNNVKELIAYAKAHPGKVNFGSGGNGITAHLGMTLFQQQAGIELTHVPYKGTPAALNDLIGGQIPLMMDAAPSAMPFVRSGKLKVLGVTSAQRWPLYPDVPTVAEQGVKGFEVSSWIGFVAPVSMPDAMVQAFSAAIRKAAADPKLIESMRTAGVDLATDTPAEFQAFLQSELKKFNRAVVASGVQID